MSAHILALLSGLGAAGVARDKPLQLLRELSWSCLLLFVCGLLLAYGLNPTDGSFKAFLTDLSFRQHIGRLREHVSDSKGRRPDDDAHVLTFTNRISVSLRTPSYRFVSYGLFSVAELDSPLGSVLRGALAGDTSPEAGVKDQLLARPNATGVFVGIFGRWYAMSALSPPAQAAEDASRAVKDRLAASVLAMERLDQGQPCLRLLQLTRPDVKSPAQSDVEDAEPSPTPVSPRKGKVHRSAARHGKRVAAVKAAASQRKTRSRSDSGAASAPTATDPASLLSTQADKGLPGIPLHTSDARQEIETEGSSPAALTADASTLVALRSQLDTLSSDADARAGKMQEELDSLKQRKQGGESARSELKSRVRTVDELKREAEQDKLSRDRQRQALEVRISSLQRRENDMLAREKRAADKRRHVEKSERESAAKRAEGLRGADLAVARLHGRIEALEHQVEQRQADALAAIAERRSPLNSLGLPGGDMATQWAHVHHTQHSPALGSAPQFGSHAAPGSRLPSGPLSAPHSFDAFRHGIFGNPSGTVSSSSFLEHRLQHQNGTPSPPPASDAPFAALGGLWPFGSHQRNATSDQPLDPRRDAHAQRTPSEPLNLVQRARNLSLPFFVHGTLTSTDSGKGATTPTSPTGPGPLSPMTPHQSSLIPSHLLDMLDDDDVDSVNLPLDASASMPSSPTPSRREAKASLASVGSPPIDLLGLSPNGPGRLAWSRAALADDDAAKPAAVRNPLAALNPDAKAFDFRPSSALGFHQPPTSTTTTTTTHARPAAAEMWDAVRPAKLQQRSHSGEQPRASTFSPFD